MLYNIFCSSMISFILQQKDGNFLQVVLFSMLGENLILIIQIKIYLFIKVINFIMKVKSIIAKQCCLLVIVHGSFNDVTALDFMLVQLDLDYRKEWDSMSVDLEICDSEPLTHSDLIYWELSWPVIIIFL